MTDREQRVATTIRSKALEMFATHGFAGTSIRDIAGATALTKAGVGYHFHSKDELLQAVLCPLLDEIEELLVGAERAPRSVDPSALLGDYVGLLVGSPRQAVLLVRDVSSANNPVLRDQIDDQHRRIVALLAGPRPSDSVRVRAWATFGAAFAAAIGAQGVEPRVVRRVAVKAAMQTLSGTGRS